MLDLVVIIGPAGYFHVLRALFLREDIILLENSIVYLKYLLLFLEGVIENGEVEVYVGRQQVAEDD